MSHSGFVPLRVFSCYTMLDGAIEPKAIAKQAAKLGFPAAALTDRNGLYAAMAFSDAAKAAGVQPVAKHAPGHGRATVDSHLDLPRVRADQDLTDDLRPFAACAGLPWMMTAHLLYEGLDPDWPATLSAVVIRHAIRGRIGFGGVLVSDDLAMNALSGTPGERAARAVAAGCDIALHCSGVLPDTADVLASSPDLSDAALARLASARGMADAARQALDGDALAAERDGLLAKEAGA